MYLFLLIPTAFVEFENSTYVVNEGAGYQQICLNSSGYDFYANFSATYHGSDNFTEGIATVIADITSLSRNSLFSMYDHTQNTNLHTCHLYSDRNICGRCG